MSETTATRRILALLTGALLLLAQLAAPVCALALDTNELPVVTLQYQSADGGDIVYSDVVPSVNGEEAVYWATLPEEAFYGAITVEIAPSADESIVFSPESGFTLDASMRADDMSGAFTSIDVFRDGEYIASYPLYISSLPMPEPELEP